MNKLKTKLWSALVSGKREVPKNVTSRELKKEKKGGLRTWEKLSVGHTIGCGYKTGSSCRIVSVRLEAFTGEVLVGKIV